MSKQQVFLIHGMGNFEKDWSLGIQEEIRKTFNDYQDVKALGLFSSFDFVEITYNDVFEKWRAQWKADADAAGVAATTLGLDSGLAAKLVSLAKSAEGDGFFKTHVLDVILYRYLKQFSEEVDQSVRRQILDRLGAFPKGQLPQWSAIAHSLGTAVLHNTLHAMFTQTVDGVLLGDAYMPTNLYMVANVGKVLWNKGGNFYLSKVRPHRVDTMGLCYEYGNFRHALDPFPMVDLFEPPNQWFPQGISKDRVYTDVVIDKADIQDVNVHALSHYWSHPNVHVSIMRSLLDIPEIISVEEHANHLDIWRQGRLANTALNKAKKRLDELAPEPGLSWEKVADLLVKFRKIVLDAGIDPREGESA